MALCLLYSLYRDFLELELRVQLVFKTIYYIVLRRSGVIDDLRVRIIAVVRYIQRWVN